MLARLLAALCLVATACSDPGTDSAPQPETPAAGETPGPIFGGVPDAPEPEPSGDPPVAQPEPPAPVDAPEGCECPPNLHCNENGLCEADVCTKGATTCASPTALKICASDGSAFSEQPCASGQVCQAGQCLDPLCQPNEKGGCLGPDMAVCNSIGTDWVAVPCPGGESCSGGVCRPTPPNIMMLVDTSGSMNSLEDDTTPDLCWFGDCPPWTYPDCDNGPEPKTRLGKVKAAITQVLQSDDADFVRLALARFPQVGGNALTEGFFGLGQATCAGGYWGTTASENGMSGDDDSHIPGAWFDDNHQEVIAVPFPGPGEQNLDALSQWFDGAEHTTPQAQSCLTGVECPGGACVDNQCHVFTNPELRAIGGTPLGKSIFYAAEYFQQFVWVEGKPCGSDADCGSANHTCVSGACHDPFAYCRPNVVLVFTDGGESWNQSATDFYHPRVQAKRAHYGLGCESDADCLSEASCTQGVCRPPAGAVDEVSPVCEVLETPCTAHAECGSGECHPGGIDYVDTEGANHLVDWAGQPRSLTIHIIDASGVDGANRLIARYGGGLHFSVDLSDPTELVETVDLVIGDSKSGPACQ